MRKVFLIGLVTFLIVAAASVCISWFMQASELKKGFEQTVARINATAPYITYDSITTSGFPSTIDLVITNPRFSGRIDQLLNQAVSAKPAGIPAALPVWQEDVVLNGTLTLSVNALSNHYSMRMSGDWKHSRSINGETTNSVAKYDGDALCSLTLASYSLFGQMWSYQIFTAENAANLFKELRAFDCSYYAGSIADQATGDVLMSAGPGRIFITNELHGEQRDLRVYIKSSDVEVSPAGDKIIAAYMAALSPDYPFPATISIYGKQNMELDFSYKGPTDIRPENQSAPMEINLGSLKISNNLYNTEGHFYFSSQVENGKRKAALNTRFESSYTEQYDAQFKEMVRGFINQALKSDDHELATFRNILQSRSAEENYSLIEPIIPNLHPLGTMVQSLNGSFQGSPNSFEGDYSLADLNISTSLYGLTGSGTAKVAVKNPFPEANISFVCANCPQMIDDILGYAGRVIGVVQAYSTEPPLFLISPRLIEGTKKFFYVLSGGTPEEKRNGNFSYIIISNPAGSVTISGRRMDAVIAMYREYISKEIENPGEGISPQGWKIE